MNRSNDIISNIYALIHCEMMFYIVFKRYCEKERTDVRLTERAIDALRLKNNLDCYDLNKIANIKKWLVPSETHFNALKANFLMIKMKNNDQFKNLTYENYTNKFLKL
jgi:hypothetical protein